MSGRSPFAQLDRVITRRFARPDLAGHPILVGMLVVLGGALMGVGFALPLAWQVAALAVGTLIVVVIAAIAYVELVRAGAGVEYAALTLDLEWDFVRPDGSLVLHHKRVLARFNHDVVSVTDSAWGDGRLVQDYSVQPGRVVDAFQEGTRAFAIVSLGRMRHRGEIERLEFTRMIADGFCAEREWVEVHQSGPRPARLSMRVLLPPERPASRALAETIGANRAQRPSVEVSTEAGRQVLELQVRRPKRGTRYRIVWTWPRLAVVILSSPRMRDLAARLRSQLEAAGQSARISSADEPISDASALLIVVADGEHSAAERRSWMSAADAAARPGGARALVLLLGDATHPPALAKLRAIRISGNPEHWDATAASVAERLWLSDDSEARVPLPEEDAGWQRSLRILSDSVDQAEKPARERTSEQLAERRAHLEQEFSDARQNPDDPTVGSLAYELATVRREYGDHRQAVKLLEFALDTFSEGFGGSSPRALDAMYNLARTEAELGEEKRARKLLSEAIKRGETSLGADHPKLRVYRKALDELEAKSRRRRPGSAGPS